MQKFLRVLNIFLERMLFDKMRESMVKYLVFLLQFMLRESALANHPHFLKLNLDAYSVKIRNKPLTEIKVKVNRTKLEVTPLLKNRKTSLKARNQKSRTSDAS